jgi:hypothetical protein
MRVLLVEPDYRNGTAAFIKRATDPASKRKDEGTLWYPPLGLMKLATFHKRRGDEVGFVIGCDDSAFNEHPDLFSANSLWDRIYITTLFTFDWKNIVKTIEFYKNAVGGTSHKIFVGGIMASIVPDEISEATGIYPITGILNSPSQIHLEGDTDIDLLPPDYSILDDRIYAIKDTYYGYTTRGCKNKCAWCGVPSIEPDFVPYIDIKPMIREMRESFGDKPRLKLMDNNVLQSPHLERIVDDLVEIGYGRDAYTSTVPKRVRVIDFNQGLDAKNITEETINLISRLNIRPMRIAFDRLSYKENYVRAVRLAQAHGFREFSNYMLYNEKDTPRDLYERLRINIELNSEWGNETNKGHNGAIYSYPMRFAPIKNATEKKQSRERDHKPSVQEPSNEHHDYLGNAVWVKRFTRNIEVMKGANHGVIPPKSSYALRALGRNYNEFIANLYMPEELLRNRNKHEAEVYPEEPPREPGDGEVERFRTFMLQLLEKQGPAFKEFHDAVAPGSKEAIKKALLTCNDLEVKEWLTKWYL